MCEGDDSEPLCTTLRRVCWVCKAYKDRLSSGMRAWLLARIKILGQSPEKLGVLASAFQLPVTRHKPLQRHLAAQGCHSPRPCTY